MSVFELVLGGRSFLLLVVCVSLRLLRVALIALPTSTLHVFFVSAFMEVTNASEHVFTT